MNLELAKTIVQHTETNYNYRCPISEGLRLITTHTRIEDVCAEHDQIWAGATGLDCIKGMNCLVVEMLAEMGWFIDKDIDKWSHFV